MKKNIKFSTFILVCTFLLFSCVNNSEPKDKSDTDEKPTTEQSLAAMQEYSLTSKIFNENFNESTNSVLLAKDQLSNERKAKVMTGSYPVVTITPFDLTSWPKTVVVNYGVENILCDDGRYRRGIVNIVTTDFYRAEGVVLNITFDNYYQNDYKVDGKQVITNKGKNKNDNFVYNVKIDNGKITTPQNKIIYYNEETSREWAEGESTVLDALDDVYYITGKQSGVSSDRVHYTLTTKEKLDFNVGCKWLRAGLLDVNIDGLPSFTINYGNGECDALATVRLWNADYQITME